MTDTSHAAAQVTTSAADNLNQLLERHADLIPGRIAYRSLDASGAENGHLDWGTLRSTARSVAGTLAQCTAPGDRVLIMHPGPIEFLTAFFGCLAAGVIAVPVPYPTRRKLNARLERFTGVVEDAQPVAVLTTRDFIEQLPSAPVVGLRHVMAVEDAATAEPMMTPKEVDSDVPAVLQYTSGSTSAPKGVIVTHRNFLTNQEMLASAVLGPDPAVTPEEWTIASWLPLFHDMGLAQALLALQTGGLCVLMTPTAFLMDPGIWLRTISRYGAHMATSPNFGYDLCVQRVTEDERRDLDLSTWRAALNGAEAVRPATLKAFTNAYSPYGFRPETFVPCYGLAEATVFVTGETVGPPRVVGLDRRSLEESGMADDVIDSGRAVVSVGTAPPGLDVRVVDTQSLIECPPNMVGEIWVHGDSVCNEYWQQPEISELTFRARIAGCEEPYLRTGDLGFHRDERIYIVGRIKDVIIVNGRNHYPEDLELTVIQSHPVLTGSMCAAFTLQEDDNSPLVVVAELTRERFTRLCQGDAGQNAGERGRAASAGAAIEEFERAARQAVADVHGLALSRFVIVGPGELPRTTSGKPRRRQCRVLLGAGELSDRQLEYSGRH
jgi:acyl-CoA synthetase (AMP-forming)/AMP-acid ligase II